MPSGCQRSADILVGRGLTGRDAQERATRRHRVALRDAGSLTSFIRPPALAAELLDGGAPLLARVWIYHAALRELVVALVFLERVHRFRPHHPVDGADLITQLVQSLLQFEDRHSLGIGRAWIRLHRARLRWRR